MIATGRFVFLHLHRSGGTFVNEWLLRFVPGTRLIGYHFPRSLIPPENGMTILFIAASDGNRAASADQARSAWALFL